MECGVEIAPQALFALEESTRCPRCKGALRSRDLGQTSVVECASCGGLWLDEAAFVRLCERAEAESVPAGSLARPPLPNPELTKVQGYIPCLACAQLMTRKNYASSSGVILDVCRNHGVWFDAQELDRVLAFIRGGGLERARQKQIETLRAEQSKLRAAKLAAGELSAGGLDERVAWRSGRARETAFGTTLDLVLDLLF
jgi:Zn-finger nucleic acid-binding protein